jgi:hypothetical protein
MVGGIHNNGGQPPINPRNAGKPAAQPPGVNEVNSTASANPTAPIEGAASTTEANQPQVLQGQLQSANALGKSQVSHGPANSMKLLMKAIPPGSQKDKLMDTVATNVLRKQDPTFDQLDEMDQALKISDIRLQLMESPEFSKLLGLKL